MIVLTENDTLRLTLLAAHTTNPVRCVAALRDIGSGSLPAQAVANSSGTTPVNVVPSPAAEVRRFVDFVTFYNEDTVNHTLTVALNANGTPYTLVRVTLGPGERLEYHRAAGFTTYNVAGAAKSIATGTQNVVAAGRSVAMLASDVTNNNAVANTIQDVTGLSFPVVAGQRYWFRFCIQYTAQATTTGSRWSIDGPANNELRYGSEYSLTTTTRTINEGLAAYNLPAGSNATSAATAGNIAIVEGFVRPTADGNIIARHASEVANSAIIARAGSFVEYMAL